MGFGNALAYGLANGASGFAQMFTRAMERADAHKRRMEELSMRRGPQLPPGVTGETDRDMRDENKSLGREFGAAVGAPKGVTPDVKYGALPPDEAAVLQQKRVGVVPDARGGRAFNTGFAEPSGQATPADLDRFRRANNANDKIATFDPEAGVPSLGSFSETMGGAGFGQFGPEREALYPSARLNADVGASPFAQTMREAANRAAVSRAKTTGTSPAKAVEAAPQGSRGDLLERLATLEPAAQMEAASALGKHLGYFGQKARQQALSDAESKARSRATIQTEEQAKRDAAKSETKRGEALETAVSRVAQDLVAQGQDPSPEAVAAKIPGLTPEGAKMALDRPRPKVSAQGEDPEQRRRKEAETNYTKTKAKAVALFNSKGYATPQLLLQMRKAAHDRNKALGLPPPEPEEWIEPFGIDRAKADAIISGK